MKKEKIMSAMMLLLMGSQVHAADVTAADSAVIETEVQETEIQNALGVLAKAKIIVLDENTHNMKIRPDVIERLKSAGKLDAVYADMGGFCL